MFSDSSALTGRGTGPFSTTPSVSEVQAQSVDPGISIGINAFDISYSASNLSQIYAGTRVQVPALQVLACIRY